MRVTPLALPEILLIEPKIFGDQRGFFVETWQAQRYEQAGIPGPFVQDNLSRSAKGTLRGLHFQEPFGQGKLVSVLSGSVLDVVVDVRRGSPSFGQWVAQELNAETRAQLWVPPGFAHGFCVLSDSADFYYKVTAPYHPETERAIAWNDPALGIDWPVAAPILSDRDRQALPLDQAEILPVWAP